VFVGSSVGVSVGMGTKVLVGWAATVPATDVTTDVAIVSVDGAAEQDESKIAKMTR
jgi:hypothetical protein